MPLFNTHSSIKSSSQWYAPPPPPPAEPTGAITVVGQPSSVSSANTPPKKLALAIQEISQAPVTPSPGPSSEMSTSTPLGEESLLSAVVKAMGWPTDRAIPTGPDVAASALLVVASNPPSPTDKAPGLLGNETASVSRASHSSLSHQTSTTWYDIIGIDEPTTASMQYQLPLNIVNDLRIHRIKVAIAILKGFWQKSYLPQNSDRELKFNEDQLKTTITTLEQQVISLLNLSEQSGERAATKQECQQAKDERGKMIDLVYSILTRAGMVLDIAEVKATELYDASHVSLCNAAGWVVLENKFCWHNSEYIDTQRPASELRMGNFSIFNHPYNEKTGVCSRSNQEEQHAVNLWVSELAKGSDTLFWGIRHGVLSAYGLKKGSKGRRQAAVNRAYEVVTAALFASGKLQQALNGGRPTVDLKLSSTSLLTPVDLGKMQEKSQLDDQLAAWQTLCQAPFELAVHDCQGKKQVLKVKLQVAVVNFGVNEFALNPLKNLGWSNYQSVNQTGLQQLIGELQVASEVGGWAGEYLTNTPNTRPPNADIVTELVRQIRDIWATGAYRNDKGEPYKMVQRIVLLSNAIGIVPCWNCQSGKDRTGMLDAEVKREVLALHLSQALPPEPGTPLEDDQKELLHLLLANSWVIHQVNTGVPGNKVLKNLPLLLSALSLTQKNRLPPKHVGERYGGASLV